MKDLIRNYNRYVTPGKSQILPRIIIKHAIESSAPPFSG